MAFAASQDTPCAYIYPEGHKRAGGQCRSRILFNGTDYCRPHAPDGMTGIKQDIIVAELKKVSARQIRKPPTLFFREGWDQRPFRPVMEAAAHFNVDRSTVVRWYAWVRKRDLEAQVGEHWEPPPRDFPENLWELEVSDIPTLIADFKRTRDTYFLTERGLSWMTPPFQERWLYKIIEALVVGGRLIILSPPRHGKTELLVHVVVWLICRFPNIRIIWVGGNLDIAKQAVSEVMEHLESNDDLIRDFCPPGAQFQPDRQGGMWSAQAFTVATRTITGIKQPTVRAVGRGGRLRSQDTDFIINDDIEDEKSTVQPMTREETRRWWTTGPDSRKEEHTALFYIGSRAHPDDLGGHLIDNDAYESVIEHAHDPACEKDPLDLDIHIDCMLFPELRSYRWLMEQKMSAETAGGSAVFQMLYQNVSTAEGFLPFTAELVDPCKEVTHHIGRIPKPIRPEGTRSDEMGGINLVAGLDPAGSGYQAAFLWAFQVRPLLKLWMVDLENAEGGGIVQARATILAWYRKYGLAHWVIEENLYHGGIVDDEIIAAYRAEYGIRTESFRTYRNKIDKRFGVTGMRGLFEEKQIILPYGDPESQAKTDHYRRQLIYYDPNAPRNRNTRAGYKSDIVMASWFPMDVIRRAQQEMIAEMGIDYSPSYSSFTGSQWNTAPWSKSA